MALQKRMAKRVVKHDVVDQEKIKRICGVDVAYRAKRAFACAVVLERYTLSILNSKCKESAVESPYIPGLLFLRESGPVLSVLEGLEYDLLMVDGHGILHPRGFGLACYVGVKVNKPTIGIGKSLLCGRMVEREGRKMVMLNNKKVGMVLHADKKPVYVSIGHEISLNTAARIAAELSRYRIPEPLRLADICSKKIARSS
jgi:deoxyribonuclease V